MKHDTCRSGVVLLTAINFLAISAVAGDTPSQPPTTAPTGGITRPVDIISLPVRDGETKFDHGHHFPGFLDNKNNIFYRWKGVALSEGPRIPVLNAPIPVNLDDTRITVVLVAPPVEYVALDGARVAPGWFDHSSDYFYQWRGIEVRLADLSPQDQTKIHDPKELVAVIAVPFPHEFVDATVEKPARKAPKPEAPTYRGDGDTRPSAG